MWLLVPNKSFAVEFSSQNECYLGRAEKQTIGKTTEEFIPRDFCCQRCSFQR